MIGIEFDNQQFKSSVSVTTQQMEKYQKYIKNRNKHYLAESAVGTMNEGVRLYWNRHYRLRSGHTDALALFANGASMDEFEFTDKEHRYKGQPTLAPKANSKTFRSAKGNKRLVSFTWGKRKGNANAFEDSLLIHSFPMNLYEEDVRLGGWAQGTTRIGTHIIRRRLPSEARKRLDACMTTYEAELQRYFKAQEGK